MNELFFRKDKSGAWICYDRSGRTAKGISKENAKNQYYLLYEINTQQYGYEIEEVDKKLWE